MSGDASKSFALVCKAAPLDLALTALLEVVPKRSTLPIFEHVLLDGRGDGLALAATDSARGLRILVESKSSAGATTVSGRALADICNRLDKDSDVRLAQDQGRLVITQARRTWRLPTLPADDFGGSHVEPVPPAQVQCEIEVDSANLVDRLARVEQSVSTEETRHYLCGVSLEPEENAVVFCSTDGHRLAWCELEAAAGAQVPRVILPASALRPVAAIARRAARLALVFADNRMTFAAGDAVYSTGFIAGNFPDWRRVVPKGDCFLAAVAVDELVGAAEDVTAIEVDIFGEGKGKRISRRVELRFDAGGELGLLCRNRTGQEAESFCSFTWLGDAPADAKLAIDARYLLWGAGGFPGAKRVGLEYRDPQSPVVFRQVDDDGRPGDECRIVMPMR